MRRKEALGWCEKFIKFKKILVVMVRDLLKITSKEEIESLFEKLKRLLGPTLYEKIEDDESSTGVQFFKVLDGFFDHLIILKDEKIFDDKAERQRVDIIRKDKKLKEKDKRIEELEKKLGEKIGVELK